MRMWRVAVLLVCLFTGQVWAAAAPSSQPAPPQTPGHHRLKIPVSIDHKTVNLAYSIYLPPNYDKTTDRKPMVVFLMGVGERGTDHQGIFAHGPQAEIMRKPKTFADLDMIVLSPQCPPDRRFDEAEVLRAVAYVIEAAKKNWRVDPARIYLTGLSMGGKGTWMLAMLTPQTFAAIAPISAGAVEPATAARTLRGVSVWIIVGREDGGFTEGSRQMFASLRGAGVDVHLTEVPGSGHDTWGRFYPKKDFYTWFTFHEKNKPPRPGRPTAGQLLAIGYQPPENQKLKDEFQKFAPWWHLVNCGGDMSPGLKAEANGRKNVFVTHPLTDQIPCMLQVTWKIPAGCKTRLHLSVGHHPHGDWRLVVRVEGKDRLVRDVSRATCRNGWMDLAIDLSEHAGSDVRIELLNAATGWNNEAGFWSRIEFEYVK